MKKLLRKLFKAQESRAKSLGMMVESRAERGIGTYLTWWQAMMVDLFSD